MRRALPLLIVFSLLCGAGYYAWYLDQNPAAPVASEGVDSTAKADSSDAAQADADSPSAETSETLADPWMHEQSDIPVSDRAIFGVLDNQMRYIIVPNNEPKDRVSLRLHIDAGSLHEADDQQGLAHFLEHMVFNGSKNFTPDELIPQMQRLGIAFGAHANAYTSFDETVYMLDLPETSDKVLDLAFTVMRDFADGALLDPQEIDKERGVILSEKNSRDSVGYRLMIQQFEDLLPNSRITRRIPIGKEDVIANAPRERFVDFYETYYVPRDMTFVLVGDVDSEQAETLIREAFSSLKNPDTPTPELDMGSVEPSEGFRTFVYSDDEVASTKLSIITLNESREKPDTAENRAQDLPLEIAHAMLNRRLSELAKQEDAAILGGSSNDYDLFNAAHIASVEVAVAEGKSQQAIAVLENEYRRAFLYGFTEFELDIVRDEILSRYEQAVESEPTRKSPSIANEIVSGINDETVFSAAATDLAIIREPLAELTPADCHDAFRELWQDRGTALIVTTADPVADSEEELVSLYKRAQSEAVLPPKETARQEWAYADFGPAGEPTTAKIDDLDIVQVAFPNGVRANLKRTDFAKNAISLRADINGGELTMPISKPGISLVAQQVMAMGGLGEHSADDLRSVLAGRDVSSSLAIGEDSFVIAGTSTPDDLELQLQLMAASIVDPGYRPEAMRQLHGFLPSIYNRLEHSEGGAMLAHDAFLHGNDPRFIFPEMEAMRSISIDDVRTWLTPALQQGYLEISIVGDLDIDATIEMLARTFGALPQRNLEPLDLSSLGAITMPQPPQTVRYTYDSKITKAFNLVSWPTEGVRDDISQSRRLGLLASILNDRLREKLREELGATYSPRAQSEQSSAFDNYGVITASSTGKPEDVATVTEVILDISDELVSEGVDADEFNRALQPQLGKLRESLRQNTYWLNTVLAGSQAEPRKLDWARGRDDDYASITADDLTELALTFLGRGKAIVATIVPKQAEE